MRARRDQQSLSYPLRLPDEIQADTLRLLDVSRETINLAVTALWDRLDAFATRTNRYAYKQVEEMMAAPQVHGHRQWRCEAEQAGRILRAQAERKQLFALILPLLEVGMIMAQTEKRRAGKNRKAIKQAVAELREATADGGSAVAVQSLIEQACNFYLHNGCFPATYEEMQSIPVLKAGVLPYAGDDGGQMGQTYRLALDLERQRLTLALRTPDENGTWGRSWREKHSLIRIPEVLAAHLKAGDLQAPSLREILEPDGTRYAVLDCIVEVPVEKQAPFEEIQTVLGFDWGYESSSRPASSLSMETRSPIPSSWIPASWMAGRLTCAVRSITSRRKWPVWRRNAIASRSVIPGAHPRRKPCLSCAGRSVGAGGNTRPGTTIWRIWRQTCSWCSPRPLSVT